MNVSMNIESVGDRTGGVGCARTVDRFDGGFHIYYKMRATTSRCRFIKLDVPYFRGEGAEPQTLHAPSHRVPRAPPAIMLQTRFL